MNVSKEPQSQDVAWMRVQKYLETVQRAVIVRGNIGAVRPA